MQTVVLGQVREPSEIRARTTPVQDQVILTLFTRQTRIVDNFKTTMYTLRTSSSLLSLTIAMTMLIGSVKGHPDDWPVCEGAQSKGAYRFTGLKSMDAIWAVPTVSLGSLSSRTTG
jgi:hypothetical protein